MPKARPDVGAELRAARLASGLSLREVADVTRITTRALEALENNEAAKLPGGIFSRAFVRAYAGHVGLDPERVLERFLQQFPDDSRSEDHAIAAWQAHEAAQMRRERTRLLPIWIGAGALVLALGVGAWWWQAGLGGAMPSRTERTPSSDTGQVTQPVSAATAEPLEPPAAGTPGSPPEPPRVRQSGPAASTSGAAPTLAGDPTGAPPPDPLLAGPAPAPPQVAVSELPDVLELTIEPIAICWVRLTVDGQLAFARVLRPGEREVRTANDQVVLDIGDASAFRFSVNGVPGRVLGRKGQVVTARISRENIQSFLAQ